MSNDHVLKNFFFNLPAESFAVFEHEQSVAVLHLLPINVKKPENYPDGHSVGGDAQDHDREMAYPQGKSLVVLNPFDPCK